MRHARLPLILASVAVLGCGGAEEAPPDTAPGAPEREEPRRPLEGSTARARVVVLGTSLTAGMGLADPVTESWAGQLQRLADSTGLAVEVVAAGVSGDTSAGGLRRLEWLLRDAPLDVLVVELGANDGLRGLDLPALEANLREMIRISREANPDATVVLAGMEAPPNLGKAYTSGFREVFQEVAEASEVHLIPFLLEGVAGDPALNQTDGIHPTPEGHRIMAETAWRVLEPLFRSAAARIGTSGEGPGSSGEGTP